MPERPCFEIGLTMAGAISAGAYTAGVIDFLLEALDAIEAVRAGDQERINNLKSKLPDAKPIFDPPHEVRIKAMSGTSAGSMVTAIVATILGTGIKPVGPDRKATDTGPTGNPLYDAWVQDIHYDKLLSVGDLDDGATVRSLLNSDELDRIVKRTLSHAEKKDYLRPYIADTLPIYFCVSNLRGVRYSLALDVDRNVSNEYQMSMHADWMGFNWSKNLAQRDGLIPVAPGTSAKEWTLLGAAALASGAFPIGLAARKLDRAFKDYEVREWFVPNALLTPKRRTDAHGNPVNPADYPGSWVSRTGDYRTVPPLDKHSDFPHGEYEFLNVDGGIFDNEPLELVRRELAGGREANPRDGAIADRAVVLIDPFPNAFTLDTKYTADKYRDLLDVIKTLFPAMIAQARFKLDELELAKDQSVASRYAIMPIRYRHVGDKDPEKYAIACGTLNGFGGFLSKAFRHHDFMLGRRNCQRFLSNHFMLPADREKGVENGLFAGWEDKAIRQAFAVKGKYKRGDEIIEVDYLPIIPLLGKLASGDYTRMPSWPANPDDLKASELKKRILERADHLKDSLLAQYKPKTTLKAGLNAYWWMNKSKWIDRFAIDTVRADLKTHGIQLL